MSDPILAEAMNRVREECNDILDKTNDSHYWDRFDEYEDAHIGAILPYEVQKPIQRLLQLRAEIKQWERIGDLNHKKITALLMEQLDQLYVACVERFKDAV